MTPAEAQAIAPNVELRRPAREIVRAAQAALHDVALAFSPYTEAVDEWAYFDASGLGQLYPSDADIHKAVAARAQRVGLTVRTGAGNGKFAARLRARHGAIPLGVLPFSALDPSPEAASMLVRWGLRTIGDLAALAPAAVGRRVGAEGALLSRRARATVLGDSDRDDPIEPLCPTPLPMRFEEATELDDGIFDLESLAFVVRGVLDRLTARLACRALAAAELEIRLILDPRGMHELKVPLRAPTRQVATMATLIRLAVAARPPDRPVRGVTIAAGPAPPAEDQLSLFCVVPPRPDELQATVGRLSALVGPEHVGSPQVVDSHRPGAQRLADFAPPSTTAAPPNATDHTAATSASTTSPPSSAHPNASVALRWLPPTVEIDPLRAVAGARVVARAGPWRISADWWSDPFERDYYAVRTTEGSIYLVTRAAETWQLVGVFD
jgi:protein ImuB